MATDTSVFRFYKISSRVFGICPYAVKANRWKITFGVMYASSILLFLIFITIYFGYIRLTEDHKNYTTIETIVNFCEVLSLGGIFLVTLNSNVRKLMVWENFFKSFDDFDRKLCGKIAKNENELFNICINKTAPVRLRALQYPEDMVFARSCSTEITKTVDKLNCEYTTKYRHFCQRRNLCFEILKFGFLHFIFPAEYLLACFAFKSRNGCLLYCPYHLGLYYKIILSAYLSEICNILTVRYKFLEEIITELFQDNSLSWNVKEGRIQQIKMYYNLLYESVECLGNLFGVTILVIFINIELNLLHCFYRITVMTPITEVLVIIFRLGQLLTNIVSIKYFTLFPSY